MTGILASFTLFATLAILDASVYMSSPFDSPPIMSTGVNVSSTTTRKVPRTPEEIEQDRIEKARRMQQRRANAREKIAHMQPNPSDLERLSPEEIERIYGMAKEEDPNQDKEEYAWLRRLWGGKQATVEFNPYQPAGMANPGASYGTLTDIVVVILWVRYICKYLTVVLSSRFTDWWAQGYRTLGPFIDCGHNKVSNNKNKNNNNKNNNNNGHRDLGNNHNNNNNQQQTACSRWMMWAAVSLMLTTQSKHCKLCRSVIHLSFCFPVCKS